VKAVELSDPTVLRVHAAPPRSRAQVPITLAQNSITVAGSFTYQPAVTDVRAQSKMTGKLVQARITTAAIDRQINGVGDEPDHVVRVEAEAGMLFCRGSYGRWPSVAG
jgi:hypothetical protein